MRTKAHRYSASVPSATFTTGTDVIGVTGDFEGGFVLATVKLSALIGAGQFITAQFAVDGVAQGPNVGFYQSGGFVNAVHVLPIRVPQGRHRISVLYTSSAGPAASSAADLNVAELNA
jgi:hypothetical protein